MKAVKIIFLVSFLLACIQMDAQCYPHSDTIRYDEPYRGQYHFSPKSGWMNDINGLVYQGGMYHMIYQWATYTGTAKVWHPRMGGYATSPDLLHWTDKGIALIPHRDDLPAGVLPNASGSQVYSGSAVVVKGTVAKNITGSEKEAIIVIHTGTGSGTCLAWSNDTGKTFHEYAGNPVVNPTKNDYPRDPCVKWYEPARKWVLALYKDGTTFYSSPDLIHWDSLSNVRFGYECPDFFELPLNGDKSRMKWVLMDAKGKYLVGNFDGVRFTKDPAQDTLLMTVGPDFYAAQTFSRENLPNHDSRIIQLAWMDCWNGGIGEAPWERNATFPVELGLVTYNGQQRITKNPIREISAIYESSHKWDQQIVKAGKNILSDVRSKKFDLSAEFDLNKTTASEIHFVIANKTIVYSIKDKKLQGETLLPDTDNHIQIRILADWSQMEIFANKGLFSYAEQVAFTPSDSSVGLVADGEVQLVKMEFHEVSRTWKEKL